jgi:hypothetical protein
MKSTVLGAGLEQLSPISFEGQSDTAIFDNALELLVMAGYPLAHAAMMMIPEAWEQHELMDVRRRAFYEYHAAMLEPWDGPAAMVFTDGKQIGATLDRNGLRPARYLVTDDDIVVMASESGVLPIPEAKVVKKWRLQPGKMFLIDIEQGRIVDDDELKHQLAFAKPYRQWIETVRVRLDSIDAHGGPAPSGESLLDRQQSFGYTQEDMKFLLAPMAGNGEVPWPMATICRWPCYRTRTSRLQLLQAAVRAGHQPADRPDPRSDRDVAQQLHRPQSESAGHQRGQPTDAARSASAGARLRRHGSAARHRAPHLGQV